MTILIIEDEKKISDILKRALKGERYAVDVAWDGDEGLEKALKGTYNLILLDLMLPKKDGFQVAKELRTREIHTPIIILTAKGNLEDKLAGLEHADDYLLKPFNIDELLARIRAVMRRRKTVDAPVWKVGDLVLDDKKRELTRAGSVVPLTPKEYRLLSVLMRRKGEVLTRRQLLDEAWGPHFEETSHELSVHMRYLRRKIDVGRSKPLIRTMRGVGYAIKED